MGGNTDPRFDRQVRFAPLGVEGQAALGRASALLVGVGALGGVLAQALVRAGLGRLLLVDRDVVELSNLPRQVLFDEQHACAGVPKVEAALEALGRIGGPTRLEAHATHLEAANLPELAAGVDLLLDGTDNLETRYLLNDWAVREGCPWIYAGVVGGSGLVLPIVPGHGACLRCLFPEPPPPGSLETCDTAGVILPAIGAVASMAAGAALRLLARPLDPGATPAPLLELDAWNGTVRQLALPRDPDCPACGKRRFDFLDAPARPEPKILCGRNTVQLPPTGRTPDLASVAARLSDTVGGVTHTGRVVRVVDGPFRLTFFPDGRALIEGTDDPDRARAIYDRILGT